MAIIGINIPSVIKERNEQNKRAITITRNLWDTKKDEITMSYKT